MCESESGFGFESGFKAFQLDSDSDSDLKKAMDLDSSRFGFEVSGFGSGFGFEMSGFAHHWFL